MSKIKNKKLQAIIFTDIVDFTKLAASDEELALDIIEKQREILKPIVEEFKGLWLKEIGDGILMSFDSSINAVRCSIKIQERLQNINDFKIRIGIHQGDIFIKDGDVYGDDVNIASRIEGFAPVGGISISDKVYKDIQGVKGINTSFIGHKPLKGVSQETKVRCITSNNLPIDKSNFFPKIIGYTNIYFGILILFICFFIGIMSTTSNFTATIDYGKITLTTILIFIFNLGLVFLLFGYSTISFHKGISLKSQKFIYYLGALYSIIFIIFLSQIQLVEYGNDDGSNTYFIQLLLNIILLTIPFIILKSAQYIYKKLISK